MPGVFTPIAASLISHIMLNAWCVYDKARKTTLSALAFDLIWLQFSLIGTRGTHLFPRCLLCGQMSGESANLRKCVYCLYSFYCWAPVRIHSDAIWGIRVLNFRLETLKPDVVWGEIHQAHGITSSPRGNKHMDFHGMTFIFNKIRWSPQPVDPSIHFLSLPSLRVTGLLEPTVVVAGTLRQTNSHLHSHLL